MKVERKQLAQARENSTNAVSVYSPGSLEEVDDIRIVLCNTSGAGATFRLFHDSDGTTYDESTALAWDENLGDGTPREINLGMKMNDSSGNIAYRSSVANAITCTVYGKIYT